jgi:hypothetical protein
MKKVDDNLRVYWDLGVKIPNWSHCQHPGFTRVCGSDNSRGIIHFSLNHSSFPRPLRVEELFLPLSSEFQKPVSS